MGVIKKNPDKDDRDKNFSSLKNSTSDFQESKIIGKVIKQDFLGKDLLSFNFEPEKAYKKIIKREEVSLPVNEIMEEIKDVNIVGKSVIEYELEEEKKKYEELNKQLQEKIKIYQEKEKELENIKNQIIESAKQQAEEMIQKSIAEAKNRAKEILEQAFNQGYEQGINQAYRELNQQYQQKIQELQTEIQKIIDIRIDLAKQFEKEIIEMVFMIAEKILNKKIQEETNVVVSYLADLLTKVERSKSITIWVNPEELEEVRNQKQNLQYLLEDVENLNIVPDERIEKGGCIIETNFGKIDSRISTKLEVLKEIVLKSK